MTIRCGNIATTAEKITADKDFAAAEDKRRKERFAYTKSALDPATAETEWSMREIPVIFHVLDDSQPDWLDEKTIDDQINRLNIYCNPPAEPLPGVPDKFQSDIGYLNISFYRDGQPIFKRVTKSHYPPDDLSMMSQSPDGSAIIAPHRYLNVYICNIKSYGTAPSPWDAQWTPGQDGIVIRPDAFGVGDHTNDYTNLGKTLAHEVGHYLGLQHIWGTSDGLEDGGKIAHSCGDTDGICDTPNQWGPNGYPVTKFPHRSHDDCPDDSRGDMYMNFMDIGPDEQLHMFTRGQVAWMQRMLSEYRSSLGL